MYTSGSCLAGGSFSTLFSGYRLVYRIDLGEVTPLGGVLTVTTCDLTRNNTVLYIGTGCPSYSASFGCLTGNDNAADVVGQSCPSNARASKIVATLSSSRIVFVQVGGYNGVDITSGLSWTYLPRSPSKTATRSPSKSATRSRSRSASKKKKKMA